MWKPIFQDIHNYYDHFIIGVGTGEAEETWNRYPIWDVHENRSLNYEQVSAGYS